MGTGCRLFFINEDDTLRHIPFARYERLIAGDSSECFPEYKDKKVRNALAFVEFYNRKPIELIAIQYSILYFNQMGQIDIDDFEMGMKLGAEMLMPTEPDPDYPNVLDAKGRFAIKRYHDRYIWTPSQDIEKSIIREIFDKIV